MFSNSGRSQLGNFLISLVAVVLAFTVFYVSTVWSFRLPENYQQLAWKVNFDRVAIIFASGFALAMSMASPHQTFSIKNQAVCYVCVVLAALGFVFGLAFSLPFLICLLAGVIASVIGFLLMRKATFETNVARLCLGIGLYLTFLASVLVYLAALVYAGNSGEFVLWLLSDAQRVVGNGYLVLSLVFVLASWAVLDQERELPTMLLLGVSLSVLGPVMFVGCLVPMIVKKIQLNQTASMLVSALLGGMVLLAITTSSNLILGGYAPALIIPLGYVGIPVMLWLNRAHQEKGRANTVEAVLILLSVIVSFVVLAHLAGFAQNVV